MPIMLLHFVLDYSRTPIRQMRINTTGGIQLTLQILS